VEATEGGRGGGRGGWGFARLLVLLPRRLHAGEGAVERAFAPCAWFRAQGAADVAFAGRLQHVLHLHQLSLVILHVLVELADRVVGAVDLLVDELLGEVLSEEGGEGGGGDVLGGEAEDLSDLYARIELGKLNKLKRCIALFLNNFKGKWVPMDHSKSKEHEGVAVYLTIESNTLKKFRIAVFEHFKHQLVIVLIEELVTVCIRS